MAARARDVVVVGVLVSGAVLAVVLWHPVGRWPALAVLLAAGLLAALVYRARPSAVPWRDDAVDARPDGVARTGGDRQ